MNNIILKVVLHAKKNYFLYLFVVLFHDFLWANVENSSKVSVYWSPGLIYEDGSCVAPADCPCEYHGMFYPSGQTLQEECNKWWALNNFPPFFVEVSF